MVRNLRSTAIIAGGLVPLWVVPVFAQPGGHIRGAVVDEEGRTASRATIVVKSVGGGVNLEIETSANGQYAHGGLAPGLYTISAVSGELGSEIFRIRIRDSQTVTVNFALEPGRRAAAYLSEAGERVALTQAFSDGIASNRSGDRDRAVEHFRRALEISPTCLECHFNLALTYLQLERLTDAELEFQRAIVLQADYVAAYYGLSDVYGRQGRDEEAAAAREHGRQISIQRIEDGRTRARDRVNEGIEFLDSGNIEGAIARFEAAIEIDTGFAVSHYWLGVAFQHSGLVPRSRSSLQRYLQLEPNGEFADQARQRLGELEQ